MNEIFEKFKNGSKSVDGWFAEEAAAIWDALLCLQKRTNIAGHLLEIGVWQGKSALLSSLHSNNNEIQLLVDPLDLRPAVSNIAAVRSDVKIDVFQKPSRFLRSHPHFREMSSSFRWIHIDGKHTSQDVSSDLSIADDLMSDDGIVSVDDFFSPSYPQVTQSVFQYLIFHPNSFKLFLCGFQKGYLCRPLAQPRYLNFIQSSLYDEMQHRGYPNVTIWKSTGPGDMNAFGITNRYLDFKYRGPDWEQNSITV